MKRLIVANWKMNPQTFVEAKKLFNSIKMGLKNIKNIEVVICPPFIYIPTFQPRTRTFGSVRGRHSNIQTIRLGAQNCFGEKKGSFTGEISPSMLKDLGCSYVILGHSGRRKLGETDEIINKKLKAALRVNLKPILCIGETEMERKKGKTYEILKRQLKNALINSSTHRLINLIVAYEPVWAVGTGNPCDPEKAKEVLLFLRKISHQLINSSINKLLYGGSVNSKNARDYIKAGFDGLLIGGASLNAREFVRIIKRVSKA